MQKNIRHVGNFRSINAHIFIIPIQFKVRRKSILDINLFICSIRYTSRQSMVPIDLYVRKPENDENGTTKAVMAAIFLGLNPSKSMSGEIIPPPPIPSNPDNRPARTPISDKERNGTSSRKTSCFPRLNNENIIQRK